MSAVAGSEARGAHVAAIALGSNLPSARGGPEANLQGAVAELRRLGEVVAVSSFHETEPVGYLDQPRFLNAAALLRTGLGPVELLRGLLGIEREFGRERSASVAKGPRTLDLDLLLYDEAVRSTEELELPHPAMHERRFVLVPLAEIAPEMAHPVLGKTVGRLLLELGAGEGN
ncbi:MAG: 2-amino-4-hydroxy-6-hydroxymethyldihydropteridine diphosphokinase [Acidobacteriaceae bacterium]